MIPSQIISKSTLLAVLWAALHVLLSIFLSAEIGTLHIFQEYLLTGVDQQEYWHVANVLLGRETEVVPHSFEMRPFFFPLFLGLTLSVGPIFYLIAQLLCLFISVFLLAKTVFKLCGSWLYVFIAMLFTLSSATLLMAPYQAMTESLCVLFISTFVYFYTCYFASGEKFY